nr:unnamed protein product [Spirometra erinaceieuropaei]
MERQPGAHGRRATTQTTLLRRRRDEFSRSRRSYSPIQGYSEVLPEASTNQPDQLGRACSRSSDMEEDSEKRHSDLQIQPHRCRQSETRNAQITTSPCTQRRRTTASNVFSMSTDIPARIGHVGHLWINCASRTALTIVPQPASSSASQPPSNSDNSSEPPLPFSSSFSSTAQRRPLRRPSRTSPNLTQQLTPPSLPPTPVMRIRTTPALTATAPSPHTSAWSVTCESVAQRLANQCMEHQPTPPAPASIANTALAPSRIARVYSAICASTTTFSRRPPATPHHNTLPPCLLLFYHHHTSTPTYRKHPTATSHASGKCASRLGPHAAPTPRVTLVRDYPDTSSVVDRNVAD